MIRKYYKFIISLLFVFLSLTLLKSVLDLGVLPNKYFNLFAGIIFLLNIIGITGLLIKKAWTKVVSGIFYFILTIICVVGVIGINDLKAFFDKSFNNAEETFSVEYYILSKNNYKEEELNSKDIYYLSTDINNTLVLSTLTNKFKSNYISVDETNTLFTNDIFVIERASFDIISEIDPNIKKEEYHVLYSFKIKVELTNSSVGEDEKVITDEEKQEEKLVAGEYYNIFVGGYDFTNTFMDFNLLVTINKTNKEVMLTSIPRDYYIIDAKVGKKDKLSDMGSRGIETNMSSIAKLFGVKIDYYVKINTSSVVRLVNAVGGITYCSNQAYTTSHATILNSYDDSKGKKLYVKKGCQYLNGIEALTVARERLAFKSGDNQRQKNCVQIIRAVGKKITVSNYMNVLNAVSGAYTTTMPREFVTDNIKAYLDDPSWTISQQSVTGSHGSNYIFFGTTIDYVMYPNMGSVNNAKNKIQMMKYKHLKDI